MKSFLKTNVIKYALVLFSILTATQSFAQNVVDSDLSNGAGSNSGHSHTGFFIAIVLLLVLSVVLAYTNIGKSKSDSE